MRIPRWFQYTLSTILIIIAIPLLYGLAATSIANFKAKRFCKTIVIGEPISDTVARANRQNIFNTATTRGERYYFIFSGLPFATAICSVEVQNDKVISKKFSHARD